MRTWAPALVAVEASSLVPYDSGRNLLQAAAGARRTRAVGCTKESERDMAQNILSLAKSIIRKIWGAVVPVPTPAVQPRPQLNGRRGYGDGSIKLPD